MAAQTPKFDTTKNSVLAPTLAPASRAQPNRRRATQPQATVSAIAA